MTQAAPITVFGAQLDLLHKYYVVVSWQILGLVH